MPRVAIHSVQIKTRYLDSESQGQEAICDERLSYLHVALLKTLQIQYTNNRGYWHHQSWEPAIVNFMALSTQQTINLASICLLLEN